MSDVPNPGSNEALLLGCLCPVFGNNCGRYPPRVDSAEGVVAAWFIRDGCPVHSIESSDSC